MIGRSEQASGSMLLKCESAAAHNKAVALMIRDVRLETQLDL